MISNRRREIVKICLRFEAVQIDWWMGCVNWTDQHSWSAPDNKKIREWWIYADYSIQIIAAWFYFLVLLHRFQLIFDGLDIFYVCGVFTWQSELPMKMTMIFLSLSLSEKNAFLMMQIIVTLSWFTKIFLSAYYFLNRWINDLFNFLWFLHHSSRNICIFKWIIHSFACTSILPIHHWFIIAGLSYSSDCNYYFMSAAHKSRCLYHFQLPLIGFDEFLIYLLSNLWLLIGSSGF